MARYLTSLVLFLCLIGGAAAAQPATEEIYPLEQLQAGQRGEVWTVFRGTEPEPFTVQVTGVVKNALGPGKSLILCELTDPRVQSMGAVAGMSGSPLYVDGKLACEATLTCQVVTRERETSAHDASAGKHSQAGSEAEQQ